MTNRGVALLGFKVLGLWLMASAAIMASGIPYYWEEPQFRDVRGITIYFVLAPALVAMGIGVPIWFSAEWFAGRLFPDESTERPSLGPLRTEPLFALALSIIGVLFVCEALPAAVNALSLFLQSRSIGSSAIGPDLDQRYILWNAATKANVTAAVARLLIGLGLLAGPTRLTAAYLRIRKELSSTIEDEAAPGESGPSS
jgi:hypothetical protein